MAACADGENRECRECNEEYRGRCRRGYPPRCRAPRTGPSSVAPAAAACAPLNPTGCAGSGRRDPGRADRPRRRRASVHRQRHSSWICSRVRLPPIALPLSFSKMPTAGARLPGARRLLVCLLNVTVFAAAMSGLRRGTKDIVDILLRNFGHPRSKPMELPLPGHQARSCRSHPCAAITRTTAHLAASTLRVPVGDARLARHVEGADP